MLDCISVENMRESDAMTIEKYTPSLTLMYRAATGVFKCCEWKGEISIVCGGGNNGGDGFALACILADNGIKSRVFMLSDKLTPDSLHYYETAVSKGVECVKFQPGTNQLSNSDMIVDCLLGTGFAGAVREPFATAIREINEAVAFTVSVDINSGMNGNTGEGSLIVKSDITLTIGFVKHGLVSENAANYIGKLTVADIGIKLLREEKKLLTPSELEQMPEHSENILPMPSFVVPAPLNVAY